MEILLHQKKNHSEKSVAQTNRSTLRLTVNDVNLPGNCIERVREVAEFTFGACVYCLHLSIINNKLGSYCLCSQVVFFPFLPLFRSCGFCAMNKGPWRRSRRKGFAGEERTGGGKGKESHGTAGREETPHFSTPEIATSTELSSGATLRPGFQEKGSENPVLVKLPRSGLGNGCFFSTSGSSRRWTQPKPAAAALQSPPLGSAFPTSPLLWLCRGPSSALSSLPLGPTTSASHPCPSQGAASEPSAELLRQLTASYFPSSPWQERKRKFDTNLFPVIVCACNSGSLGKFNH